MKSIDKMIESLEKTEMRLRNKGTTNYKLSLLGATESENMTQELSKNTVNARIKQSNI